MYGPATDTRSISHRHHVCSQQNASVHQDTGNASLQVIF